MSWYLYIPKVNEQGGSTSYHHITNFIRAYRYKCTGMGYKITKIHYIIYYSELVATVTFTHPGGFVKVLDRMLICTRIG